MRIIMESRMEEMPLVGAAIVALCLRAGMESEECRLMELAVLEAVANAIKHAYSSEPGHELEVDMGLKSGEMEFKVADTGRPFEDAGRVLDFCPEDALKPDECGMGLRIMKKLMDKVSYESSGGRNVMTLIKKIKNKVDK